MRRSFIALILFTAMLGPRESRSATPPTVTIYDDGVPVSFQTALIGGANPTTDRSTCVFGVSCDTLHLVIAPGNYTGKRIRIAIDWLVPANDFDMYCFEDYVDGVQVGISNGPPPGTHEEVPLIIDGVVSTARTIAIEVVASTTVPEQVQGTVSLVATPRTAARSRRTTRSARGGDTRSIGQAALARLRGRSTRAQGSYRDV